jgi:hypothetical protein
MIIVVSVSSRVTIVDACHKTERFYFSQERALDLEHVYVVDV